MTVNETKEPTTSPELVEFLRVLHEIVAAGNRRLASVTSPEVANQFAGAVASEVMPSLGFQNDPNGGLDAVKKFLGRIGVKFTTTAVGEVLDCEIECPFAKQLHSGTPDLICPTAMLVLGAVRMKERGALIQTHTLTDHGAHVIIGPNPITR